MNQIGFIFVEKNDLELIVKNHLIIPEYIEYL
jgi:hypothetical protein